jgi:hypothetical protein
LRMTAPFRSVAVSFQRCKRVLSGREGARLSGGFEEQRIFEPRYGDETKSATDGAW